MNKIISRFYLITIDNKPVYVGYTNRTVKQRFREHVKDKDLPEKSEVKQIDKLEFDFTWDIDKVYDNANLISKREGELILKYKTQDSIYQKGLCDKLGGQTWSSVKCFVYSNKDNPKYKGMSSQELLEYLDNYRKHMAKLHNFIIHYQDPRLYKLQAFISNYKDPRLVRLYNFISHYKDPRLNMLCGFISSYKDPRLTKLYSFITHYQDLRLTKLSNFIVNYKDPRLTKLHSFVVRYKDPRLTKLSNFVVRYKH